MMGPSLEPHMKSKNQPTRPNPGGAWLNKLSLAVLMVAVLFVALRFVPAARLSLIYAAGNSPTCSYSSAIGSESMLRDHLEEMEKIRQQSRIISTDENGLRAWETPFGRFVTPQDGEDILISVLAEQAHEIYGGTQHGVRKGDVVLDCGAHVGAFTRQALKAGASLVVAIEPSPANLPALKLNLADEIAAKRVIVYEKGVWDSEGEFPFYIDPDNSAGSAVVSTGHSHSDHPAESEHSGEAAEPNVVQVPLTRLDTIVAELGLETVDFIKLDIEGAERNALRGASETLATHRPRVSAAAYHLGDDETAIPEAVLSARADYEMICGPCGEQDGRIVPHTLTFY